MVHIAHDGSFFFEKKTLNRDHYFTTVAWANDKEVFIAWLNRHQNVSHLSFCNVETSSCDTVEKETSPFGIFDDFFC